MFKAVHADTGEGFILAQDRDDAQLEQLRALTRQDRLICQVCRQPVSLRVCQERRSHFAHRDLADCPLHSESPDILAARMALYEFIRIRFGERTTLERLIDGAELPRPVDCWVDLPSGQMLAWWILDAQLRPEARHRIVSAMTRPLIHVNWVFLRGMLHTPPNSTTHVILSTTERDLITGSPYDVLYRPGYSRGSLHYIDPAAMELLTYRALTEVHPPQEYEGFLQVTPLTHALVRPRTGKFVHPGEHKRLTDYGRELKRVEQERRARGLDRFGNTCTTEPRRSDPAGTSGRAGPPPELARPPPQEEAEPFHEAFADPESMKIQDGIRQRYERLQRLRTEDTNSDDTPEGARMKDRDTREGICEICHRKTRDWVVFDHGTGTCKCRTCLGQPGRSRPTDAKDEMPHG